ncbi:unnamed protein product [Owenia fusiformis]|uniref:Glucose-methanol-choline oxidoreductase N-terminal domain-containing protein n=1 Tax=Owenia fusiformis TaxID=6347 RepID=A0A8S4PEV0_OWEFU|nr:unnamed protein product [Owenia fusiformis]
MLKTILATLACVVGVYVYFVVERKNSIRRYLEKEYDYVIVGAGSAGAVIAARLTEDPSISVLLLEAGDEETASLWTGIPLAAPFMQQANLDWNYTTVPQEHCCTAFKNRVSKWPRGKALGGTSITNYMVYVRGNRQDYDDWADMGNTGWSYRDILPYYKRAENMLDPTLAKSDYHGTGGPLHVSTVPIMPATEVLLKAAEETGQPILDYNGESQFGFSQSQATITKNGVRASTVQAYLRPNMDRENLHIAIKSHATKIIFEDKTAVGVEFIRDQNKHTVRARKEVIISAGAVGSPQLLMLSGIGPKKHLEDLHIPVLSDLPVGENLQDHPATDGIQFITNKTRCLSEKESLGILPLLQYFLMGTGDMTMPGALNVMGFMKSPHQPVTEKQPIVQIHALSVLLGSDAGEDYVKNNLGYSDELWNVNYGDKEHDGKWGVSILPTLLKMGTTGVIKLKSSDPFDFPLIDPKYYKNPLDVKHLVSGIKYATEKLGRTKAFKDGGFELFHPHHPHCKKHKIFSDAYWECFVRTAAVTIYHPTSTCRMGPVGDNNSVVDPQLRVKGVKNLRVADASIMPQIVAGNTNAPSIMIGEKASDLIRGKTLPKANIK